MLVFDRMSELSNVSITADGYLKTEVRVARTGIQTYLGKEIGKPERGLVRVYRPADEVFATDALASYANRPVTLEHPPESVTSGNWAQFAVGSTVGAAVQDGDFVKVPILINDTAAIEAIQAGKRQLSMGYDCVFDWTPGVTPEGEPYDCRQTTLRMNHVAVVGRARGGSSLVIDKGDTPMKTVVIDGVPVELQPTHAALVEKTIQSVTDANATIAARDAEIGKLTVQNEQLTGENTALKQKVADSAITPAKLSAMVAERQTVIDGYRAVTGDDKDVSTKTDAELKRAAVTHVIKDRATNMSDEAINGAFSGITATAAPAADPMRDAATGVTDSNPTDGHFSDKILKAAGITLKKG